MDTINWRILEILQEDGRASTAAISRALGIAQSAVHDRIRKLKADGVITGFTVQLDPTRLDAALTAFLWVSAADPEQANGLANRIADLLAVQEVHHTAGEDGLLVKVKTGNNHDLWRFLREEIHGLPGLASMRTTLVMETVKERAGLPLKKVLN